MTAFNCANQENPNIAASSLRNTGFYKNTLHRTATPGAIVTFTFNGTAAWYFSDIDSTHGMVQISVDGEPSQQVSGFHDPKLSQRLIWHKTGLPPGLHQVTITHDGTPAQFATVDFFGYLPSNATAMIPGGIASSTDTSTAQQPQGESKRRNFHVAAMTGIVIGTLVVAGVLYGIYLVYRRQVHWARYIPKQLSRGMQPTQGAVDRIVQYEAVPFIATNANHATGTSIYNSTLTAVSDTSADLL
ncbi:Podoplanin domain-containing protein [Rhizoctonia solani AG-1 IA]|uniref:Podoplanin domain-containing protein n=1 Tax=Thanatephorus cucumeris (strain AG1-IA) TaxID=983506 RepID=L8WQR3_THACA|nr:Podoplanin domain-containing protein [Rhizoctonia solani AG-1 IA]